MVKMFDMLKNAHKLKREMGKLNEGLAGIEAEGSAGNEAVRVRVDGQMKLKEIKIDPKLLEGGDAKSLEKLIVQALDDAQRKAQKLAAGAMSKLVGTGGLPF